MDGNEYCGYLEKLIALLPGNIYWKDEQGHFLGCNNAVAKVLKLSSAKDIVGKTNDDLFPGELAKLAENADKEVMLNNKQITLEEIGLDESGNQAIYLTEKTPLHDSAGKVSGILGVSIDITDRKKAELALKEAKEQAEGADLKNAFIHNMVHDIRTPTAGLYGLLRLMADQETEAEQKMRFEVLADCADELLRICNDIVSFQDVEYGTMPILEKKFNVQDLVKRLVALEQPAVLNKKLKMTLEIDKNVPQVVKGDDRRLQRILINLLGNAIKFTKEGEINFILKHIETRDKKDLLQFIICDTGMGIPEEFMNFIYEKFVRGTPANKGLHKGNGLGLRIVKKFVDELGGEINVKSKVGDGTTFKVTLPFVQPLIQEADEIR